MNPSQAGAHGRDIDAAPGTLRPLRDFPEAAHGGMPPARIARVLADLVAELTPLHAGWRVHGALSLDTVGVDESGRAHLLTGPASPAADAESFERAAGYAAFEQYTDDPQHPCGPWTDVYGLSALAYALATGEAPVPALLRCVRDDQVPLAQRLQDPAAAGFAQVVDAGLSMDHRTRPATLDALLQRIAAATSATESGVIPGAAVPPVQADRAVHEPISAPVAAPAAAAPPPPVAFVPPPAAVPAPRPPATPEPIPAPIAKSFPGPTPAPASAPASVRPAREDDEDRDERAAAAVPVAKPAKPAQVSIPMVLLVLVVIGCAVFFWMRMQGDEAPVVADRGGAAAVPFAGSAAGASGADPGAPADRPATGTPPSLINATPADSTTGSGPSTSQVPSPPPVSAATPEDAGGVPSVPGASLADGGSVSGPGPTPGQPGSPGASLADGPASTPAEAVGTAQPGIAAPAADGAPGTVQPSTPTATSGGTDLPPAATASTDALAAAAAEAPPKPAAATVTLNIRPWGEVLVDGKPRGASPPLRQLTLPAGRHTITVRNPAAADYQVSLDLSDGRNTSVSHNFE